MSLTNNIILKAAILEEALKVYKVAAYHELKIEVQHYEYISKYVPKDDMPY